MKIDQLNYFIETAKHEHIGKASKILGISPSAISHSIAFLEDELGRKLFERKGKNIHLTGHGKYFAENIEGILHQLDLLKDKMTSDEVDHQGHYKLVGTHVIAENFLAPVLSTGLKNNKKVSAELYSLRSAKVVEEVISGKFDLGVCFSPQDNIKIETEDLFQGNLLLYVAKNHPLLSMTKKKQIENLSNFTHALPKSFQGIDNCERNPALIEMGVTQSPQLLYDSVSVCVNTMLESEMFSFLPDCYGRIFEDKISPILTKECFATYSISALWPSNRVLTKFLREYINDLKNYLT